MSKKKIELETEDRDGNIFKADLESLIDDNNKAFKMLVMHACTANTSVVGEIFMGVNMGKGKDFLVSWKIEERK